MEESVVTLYYKLHISRHNLDKYLMNMNYCYIPGGRAVVPSAAAAPVGGAAPVVEVLAPGVPARVDAMLTCRNGDDHCALKCKSCY